MSRGYQTYRAPGKLILTGEYAVLEGATAVVMAVDRYAGVSTAPAETATHQVSAAGLGIADYPFRVDNAGTVIWQQEGPREQELLRFFRAALETALPPQGLPEAVSFRLNTDLFYLPDDPATKLGFGSSAALTVALVRAVSQQQDPAAVFQLALQAHYAAQEKLGSGIDIAASTYGGLLSYRLPLAGNPAGAEIRQLDWPDQLQYCGIFSGKAVSTRNYVQAVYRWRDNAPADYRSLMQRMSAISQQTAEALGKGDSSEVLRQTGEYGRAMQALGEAAQVDILSAEHRQITRLAGECGTVYKPSGAGGGDIGIALGMDAAALRELQKRCRAAGFKTIGLQIAAEN